MGVLAGVLDRLNIYDSEKPNLLHLSLKRNIHSEHVLHKNPSCTHAPGRTLWLAFAESLEFLPSPGVVEFAISRKGTHSLLIFCA